MRERSVSLRGTSDVTSALEWAPQITVLASAARTTTTNSSLFVNEVPARGVHVVIDVTAASGTPSVTFTVQGYSPLGDDYYTLLASAAITGTGTTILKVYPGLTAAANTVASDVLPGQWRVAATHGESSSITYSVGAWLLP